jgi:hemolysin III
MYALLACTSTAEAKPMPSAHAPAPREPLNDPLDEPLDDALRESLDAEPTDAARFERWRPLPRWMAAETAAREETEAEEVVNSLTHGLGLALASAGTAALLVLAGLFGETWHMVTCGIYGASLIFVYAASTLFHSARAPRVKRALRLVDHIAIFFLIAGTYTPITFAFLRNGWGWTLLAMVWGLAAFGLVFKLVASNRLHWVAVVLYLAMGWMGILFAKPLWMAAPAGALVLLAAGGLAYTVGVVFYAWRSLRYSHAIWHLFVLAGSACHYAAVVAYVLP